MHRERLANHGGGARSNRAAGHTQARHIPQQLVRVTVDSILDGVAIFTRS